MRDATQRPSRRRLLFELRRRGPSTLDSLVASSGLSKTATRAHLVRMERDGIVERVAVEAEGPGRPPAAFRLTESGAMMFPTADDALLSRLLRFLDAEGAGELIAAFFEEVWSERLRELLEALGTDDVNSVGIDERLSALESVLADRSFMPAIERTGRSDGSEVVTVRECNCPFPAAARASRVPCRLEIDFVSKALGTCPRSLSIADDRAGTCAFEFVLEAPRVR